MTDAVMSYIIFGVVLVLVVFSLSIGLEKMIKVILGNYILGSLCLAANQSIDILITFFQASPQAKAMGISFADFGLFLVQGKTTIVMILYGLLLFLMYHKSKLRMSFPSDEIIKKSLYLLFVPLTVVSMILTLEIVFLGVNSLNIHALEILATSLTKNVYVYSFLTMTPVWILIHGIATVLISSEIKISLKTDL